MAVIDLRVLGNIFVGIIIFNGALMPGNGCYKVEASRISREAPSNFLSSYQGPMEEHRPGCGHPDANANSRAVFFADWAQPGSVVNYTCDPGFHSFGSESRICRPDGTWSGDPLLCVRKISTGKSMQCVSQSCSSQGGPQMAHAAVDDVDQTCENVPTNTDSQWKLDLLGDYQAIRQFRLVFHGKGTDTPVVKIYLESSSEATHELAPSECLVLRNVLPLDYHEFIIRPNRAARARYVNIHLKSRSSNGHGLCEAEVYSEDEPSVHQCFDLNLLDGSVQAQYNLKRTFIHEGRCYTMDDTNKVYWKTANQNCQKVSQGSLAHDLTPSINKVLVNFLKVANIASNYWIGGQVVNSAAPGAKGYSYAWQWLNGKPISKELFNPLEVREDHCLAISAPGGVWLDFPCHAFTGSICQAVIQRCGSPKRNLRVLTTNALVTDIGAVITHDCPPGFQLTGDRVRRCLPNGQWSGSSPNCYGAGDHQQQMRNRELPAEAIAGIIAGVVVGLILIAAVLIMVLCRRKGSFKKTIHFNKNGKHGESVETLDKEDVKGKDKERLKSETKENYQAVNPDDCETK